MTNGVKLDETEFAQLETDRQMPIIFKNTERILLLLEEKEHSCAAQLQECGEKFAKLEKRKLADKAYAAGAGLIGGFLAVLSKGKIW